VRIGVISRDVDLATTRRLLTAGERLGYQMVPLRVLDLTVRVGFPGSELLLGGERTPHLDAFIPRLGAYLPELVLAASRALIRSGAQSLNEPESLSIAFDKLRTAECLSAAGIPTPWSVFAKDLDHLDSAIDAVGGPPVVIKPLNGGQGRGVMLAETRATAVAILENLILTGRDHLVQELVTGSIGEDRRLLVLDGTVIASIRRIAKPGEFRPNLHRGGRAEVFEPTDEESELAIAAARTVGLRFAGVDVLSGSDGSKVIEVNGSPGLEGIERATGLDLASEVLMSLAVDRQTPRVGAGSVGK